MATFCGKCGAPLQGRQRRWCSPECQRAKNREDWLRKVYDISVAEYEAILEAQGGVCGICGKPPGPGRSLAVDHEHRHGANGPIRGLLCFFDNRRVIGARSADSIIRAAEYLQNPPAKAVLGERIAPGRPKKKKAPRKRKR